VDDNPIVVKSKAFALKVVMVYKDLQAAGERVLSKQFLRSGTSIGANIAEGQYAQSKADFLSKYSIALKETAETRYWIDLLIAAQYLPDSPATEELVSHCDEMLRLLTASVKKLKEK